MCSRYAPTLQLTGMVPDLNPAQNRCFFIFFHACLQSKVGLHLLVMASDARRAVYTHCIQSHLQYLLTRHTAVSARCYLPSIRTEEYVVKWLSSVYKDGRLCATRYYFLSIQMEEWLAKALSSVSTDESRPTCHETAIFHLQGRKTLRADAIFRPVTSAVGADRVIAKSYCVFLLEQKNN